MGSVTHVFRNRIRVHEIRQSVRRRIAKVARKLSLRLFLRVAFVGEGVELCWDSEQAHGSALSNQSRLSFEVYTRKEGMD